MSATVPAEFAQLQETCTSGGVDAVLSQLADQLRDQKKYHELFEALKMQTRHKMGLPLTYTMEGEDLDDDTRDKLERGLLDACREVGLMLLEDGRIAEGWMYLRPVGDRQAAREALAKIEADDENLDALTGVLLGESVDVKRGFALMLEHHGTCNAITTYDSQLVEHSLEDRRDAAELLVAHLHGELVANVKADISQQEGTEAQENTLRELVADRDWMFTEHSYHVDTTHLAAVVRASRLVEDPKTVRTALDLTYYGRELNEQFQYDSEEPFADFYPSHAFYFQAVLGENTDEAIGYFRNKAETLSAQEHGPLPVEVYVQVLSRAGKPAEAIEASIALIDENAGSMGVAPTICELSQQAGDFTRMAEHCRETGDLLGYATALAHAAGK